MIDKQEKIAKLLDEMTSHPALKARLPPQTKASIRKQDPKAVVPSICDVIEIIYMGDEGGITCRLDIETENNESVFFVSITNLTFDRRCTLYRQINAYQRHRIKKLKKQFDQH